MTYLFLDTSSNTLIISLIKNDTVIETTTLESCKEHSTYAVEKINQILKNNNLTPNEVDKLFVVTGPGSFTGVRIGVTIAKTYAYCLNKDVVPISALKMKILEYKDYDNYVSIIKDKKNFVFCGIYDKNYNTLSEELIDTNELSTKLTKLSNYKLLESEESDIARKDIDILSIVNYYKKVANVNPHELKPMYLKEVI